MRLRGWTAIAVALVTALTISGGAISPAGASGGSQQHAASLLAPSSVSVLGKNTLPQTSLGSPAFITDATGAAIIGWTGTDAAHHLNVSKSAHGLTNYGPALVLGETSIAGPALAQLPPDAGGNVLLAWTGTDAAHHLNLLFDVYGMRKKVTFGDTSFTSPAIAIFSGDVLLAWAGNDPNHSLNVMRVSLSSFTIVARRTFTFGSNEGPTLVNVTVDTNPLATRFQTVLGFTNKSSHLQFATTSGSLDFMLQPALNETSPFAPVMVQFHTEGGPEFWIAWTGTDSAHHLNVKWTTPQTFPAITGNKTILSDTAFGHPGLGFSEGVLLAWTGTDGAHHLNVLRFTGF